MAMMTLIGMYNFDNTLFDGINIQGIDKEVLVKNILIQSGDYEVLYPDIDFLKMAIANWNIKYQNTFKKWLKGVNADWNPIENYDRYEDTTDTAHSSMNGQDSNDSSGHGTNTNKRSAFDSSDFENDSQSSSDTSGHSATNTHSDTDANTKHTAHIHGNIGVTTSAAMVMEFQQVATWNIYEHITDLFLSEFVIPIL